MSISPLRLPSCTVDEWDVLVAREVRRQGDIEAAFDRADACEGLGDFRLALHWLDRARELSGGLSQIGWAQRARIMRELDRGPL
jgi:hypothetical protein